MAQPTDFEWPFWLPLPREQERGWLWNAILKFPSGDFQITLTQEQIAFVRGYVKGLPQQPRIEILGGINYELSQLQRPPDWPDPYRIGVFLLQVLEFNEAAFTLPKWSPPGTMKRWEGWFKLAKCAASEDTIERRIKGGSYIAKQPREKGRLILDINTLPREMQSEEFWKLATTPH